MKEGTRVRQFIWLVLCEFSAWSAIYCRVQTILHFKLPNRVVYFHWKLEKSQIRSSGSWPNLLQVISSVDSQDIRGFFLFVLLDLFAVVAKGKRFSEHQWCFHNCVRIEYQLRSLLSLGDQLESCFLTMWRVTCDSYLLKVFSVGHSWEDALWWWVGWEVSPLVVMSKVFLASCFSRWLPPPPFLSEYRKTIFIEYRKPI